ncbi:protein phosphatase 1 regulatory subunit 26 [Nycticebus coucang]|uniref:protein phosphatase 1 regulatory subunit 26 n=1 Tax=Nycticebus coucang TaxID=9470 RepID=UPI00234C2695|nr:protein phosphatase 1 regulatory subunit 26 [Nycticebus coucang]XP_053431330.1 protein phosphatase 1 regulatory subunit 26 [Nycticebus coucang]XP_053431341.1 protein phosphatase 1 regulatory subunit 26 [Nycticebus coucang]XP_053431351.1 protein phosphatase 1 regulatory subunit 26 [Nycticebus coucang]XP_053431359.1 protein phosphatase 1 regulatory subunit 26 [Nycticebus coucang]XP_053431369.1 protein phosphatase 1 regulatory subunit 26 [Nycticebus coucang]XP_053431378.1 protein phosphatase 
MFLMNAPPVVALQSKWEAFGPPGSFRFPGCFSESKEGVKRASVSAKVQMILSSLQRDEAALGMNHERAPPRSQRAERCRDTRLAANPAVCKEQPAFAACGRADSFDPMGEEEAADLGPLVLDSDSDDSVDRDIEEAIQEYLKAKGGATQPVSSRAQPSGAQPSGATGGTSRCKPEPPHNSAPAALCPPKLIPGSHVGASKDQGSTSPVSVSSDDSFEQSIRAEIEQFLNEKRQHETPKCDGCVDKKLEPNENSAKSLLKSCKELTIKGTPRQDLKAACKEFVFRKPPRFTKVNAQPRSLRSKITSGPETLGSIKPAALKPATPCRPAEATQSKGGVKRSVGTTRRGKRVRSAALVPEGSDSSSDDGIEAAIQLYQLEKTRKEASGGPPQRAPCQEDKRPDPPADNTSSAQKSALPETHRKTPSKKKSVAAKPAEPGPGDLDASHSPKLPKETKTPLAVSTASRSELVERSSCRADTSAELMCAEAILDISKAILPAPVEGSDRSLSTRPLFYSSNVPSCSGGDSSSVDSDDSIEQEIRTFLALKAQSGSSLARAEIDPQAAQRPLSPPGPNSQTGGPRAPLPTPDLSLSCKRKYRGSSHTARPSTPKKTREVVKEGGQDIDHALGPAEPGCDGQDLPSQGKAGEAPGREGEARRPSGAHVPQSHCKAVDARCVDEKESSEDKSSSLDSDEDLDTAIKDLLRSKRKLKKRCKDPKAACKKKVRFSTTETQFLDKPGGCQRDWKDRSPQVLKSCLSKSKRDSGESPVKRPPSIFGSVTERTKLEGTGDQDVAPTFQLRRNASEGNLFPGEHQSQAPSPSFLSDDSSSVDSNDSIELEIRKFLAEKAKESVSSSEVQAEGAPTLGLGGPARPEVSFRKEPALQPGVCTRSQRVKGAPQLTQGLRGAERAGTQRGTGLFSQGGKSLAAPARGTTGTISAKGSPSRRNVYVHKDHGPRGAEPAVADSGFGQLPSCAKAGTEAGGAGGTFHVSYGSRSFPTPSSGAERDTRPQADLTLPWSDFAHQSRLPSPWALNSEGRDSAWRGGLGNEREKRPEGLTRGPPSLPFTGFSPLLSTQLFHFGGKSVSWGGKQAAFFSPHTGLPLQGPSFSAFREAQAGPSPVFGSPHLLGKKDGGSWPRRKAQAGLGLHDRKNSGPEENILDLRYRQRVMDKDDQDQEALGSDASDFSDTSMEDGGGCSVVKGKALKL